MPRKIEEHGFGSIFRNDVSWYNSIFGVIEEDDDDNNESNTNNKNTRRWNPNGQGKKLQEEYSLW